MRHFSVHRSLRALAALLIVCSASMSAQAQDIPGAQDHPLVGRYEGSALKIQIRKDYEEQRILTKAITSADTRTTGKRINANNSIAVAGKSARLKYEGPSGRSPLEISRNFEAALQSKGFETLFQCRGADCSNLGGSDLYLAVNEENPMGRGQIRSNPAEQILTTAVLKRAEGDVYVSLYVSGTTNGPEALIDVIETAPMQTDQIAFVDASQMQKDIDASGRVALYGILFDFDKATIRADSKATLDEIAKFLKANTSIKVVVAGHTDAKGAFDYNVDLSRRRAIAVVDALVKDYGIAASRLQAFGVGMASPVASNDNEAGQAKNRRVELVKMN